MILSYLVSFSLGAVVGLERQYRQRTAGLRTHILVSLGASAFSELGFMENGVDGATRVVSYIVSGIGFLGAGAIIKEGSKIRGLDTAATLWCCAGIGSLCGLGFYQHAIVLSLLIVFGNTGLRPISNWIDRRPFSTKSSDAEYRVLATCIPENAIKVRDILDTQLAKANYPIRTIEISESNDKTMTLSALLVPSSVNSDELDTVTSLIESSQKVISSTWTMDTTS